MHLTESCDDDTPHLITHVETTSATQPDVEMTEPIHRALSVKDALPKEHLVDNGYVSADLLIKSQDHYHVELVGPVRYGNHWQAKEDTAMQ